MHPNSLIELATELLHQVMQFTTPADRVVSDFFRTHRQLGPRERHTLAETTYGVVRRRLLYQHLAQSGRGEQTRRLVLLGWQGNAGFLKAALSDDEQSWLTKVQQIDQQSLPEKLQHNLPEWLAELLKVELGDNFWPLVRSLQEPAALDARINTAKCKRDEAVISLNAGQLFCVPTPYSPWGVRFQGKPAINKHALFEAGSLEIQDEGSQILALLTDAKRGEMVVDFCAGAGGKTLALGAAMRNTGRLYAFDISGHRLAALKPRLARSGLSNVYPAQIAHERDDRIKRLAGKVDRVLVDAPCSGLGTLRRNPDMKWRQSPASVQELAAKQASILNSAARLLKPGGRLVYATCSLLAVENEGVANAFSVAQEGVFRRVPALQALEQAHVSAAETLVDGDFLRLWPHQHQTDGFFAAIWQRC